MNKLNSKNRNLKKVSSKKKNKKRGQKSKKKILRAGGRNNIRAPQGSYQLAPDYSISTIDINSYSGNTYHLKCTVCGGNEFMLGQGIIKSGRLALGPLNDKQTRMCVCANCSHIMWFRKSSFVNKKDELYSRQYGYSYGKYAGLSPFHNKYSKTDKYQIREKDNMIHDNSYEMRKNASQGWMKKINPYYWMNRGKPERRLRTAYRNPQTFQNSGIKYISP